MGEKKQKKKERKENKENEENKIKAKRRKKKNTKNGQEMRMKVRSLLKSYLCKSFRQSELPSLPPKTHLKICRKKEQEENKK